MDFLVEGLFSILKKEFRNLAENAWDTYSNEKQIHTDWEMEG